MRGGGERDFQGQGRSVFDVKVWHEVFGRGGLSVYVVEGGSCGERGRFFERPNFFRLTNSEIGQNFSNELEFVSVPPPLTKHSDIFRQIARYQTKRALKHVRER